MSDSFADAPVSLGEVRSDRDDRAGSWAPREALISLLRKLDRGEIDMAGGMIVIYRWREGGDEWINHVYAGMKRKTTALGMIEIAKRKLLDNG